MSTRAKCATVVAVWLAASAALVWWIGWLAASFFIILLAIVAVLIFVGHRGQRMDAPASVSTPYLRRHAVGAPALTACLHQCIFDHVGAVSPQDDGKR